MLQITYHAQLVDSLTLVQVYVRNVPLGPFLVTQVVSLLVSLQDSLLVSPLRFPPDSPLDSQLDIPLVNQQASLRQ